MPLTICIAQLNCVAGDIAGNSQKIMEAACTAHANGARLLVTPELALCGYAAHDWYLRPAFLHAAQQALDAITQATTQWPGLTVVLGHPQAFTHTEVTENGNPISIRGNYNVASVLCNGRVQCSYAKQALNEHGYLEEERYFHESYGACECVFEWQGMRVGLLLGAETRLYGPLLDPIDAGAQLLLALGAAPWYMGQAREHEEAVQQHMQDIEGRPPLLCAQLVGGQDNVVFAGHSFALQADGSVTMRAPGFQEALVYAHITPPAHGKPVHITGDIQPHAEGDAELWHALVLGLRDYAGKNGFRGAVLGLSGGMDSALVLALAVDALGADQVRTLLMPSPYTADISLTDARDMAERLGVRYDTLAIAPLMEAFGTTLAGLFAGLPEDTTEENLQARIRGMLLMALSNKFHLLLLATGNKSEIATGYCTLYGDTAGGFAPIKDVLKTRVFALARWRNANDPYGTGANPIPERIITRPPSAELRPEQTDQDSLPAYEVLDAIIERYVEHNASMSSLVAEAGFTAADVQRVVHLIHATEYKRQQSAPGTQTRRRSLGRDWHYPLTQRFRIEMPGI